jgi:hypothetical protein
VSEEWITRDRDHGNVMSTVKWCNKEDLGFEGRIQGDVIFAEVEPTVSKMTVHKDYIDEVIYYFTVGKKFKMCITLHLKNTLKEKFKTGDWRHDLKNLMDHMKTIFRSSI